MSKATLNSILHFLIFTTYGCGEDNQKYMVSAHYEGTRYTAFRATKENAIREAHLQIERQMVPQRHLYCTVMIHEKENDRWSLYKSISVNASHGQMISSGESRFSDITINGTTINKSVNKNELWKLIKNN